MEDYVLRITGAEGSVRAFVARTTNIVEEARKRHNTYPTASAALGRVLTAVSMLGITLKGEDTITMRVTGDGPLGGIVAVANAQGEVRGYVHNPLTHVPSKAPGKLDVGRAVGAGMLHITKDLGLKDPYTGSIELVSGEIGDDLASYFQVSEQTPSAVGLGVLVETDNSIKVAGGFIIQLLPNTSEEVLEKIEENLSKINSVTSYLNEGKTPEEMAELLFAGFDYTVHEKIPVKFFCNCSQSRLEKVLVSLGKEELESIIAEQGAAHLTCHFCGDEFNFSKENLEQLLTEASQ